MKTILMGLVMALVSLITAQAQLEVSVNAVKSNLIAGEKAAVTITITNNSGRAIKFENKGKTPWMTVHVVHGEDIELPPIGKLMPSALSLAAGESRATKVDVSRLYDLSSENMYRAYISLINPLDGQHYTSSKAFLNVHPGSSLWSKKVGIPAGFPRAGNTCKYSILNLTLKGDSFIYIRLEDVDYGQIIHAACIGKWTRFGTPAAEIDSSNRLHVLYLATNDTYVHVCVDPSGKFAPHEFYKRSDEVAASLVKSNGQILVSGGLRYDPKATGPSIKTPDDIPF